MLHYIILYCSRFYAQYVTQNIKRRKNARNAGNYSDSSSFPKPHKTVILEFARPLSVFCVFFNKTQRRCWRTLRSSSTSRSSTSSSSTTSSSSSSSNGSSSSSSNGSSSKRGSRTGYSRS